MSAAILTRTQFLARIRQDERTLDFWIEQSWLIPEQADIFREQDIARAALIADLIDGFGVNEAGVDLVLHLTDQVHGLRAALAQIGARLPAK